MKQKFSTKWKSSKQPRKKRKYIANAPLHIKRKFLGANLSKSLRTKYKKRSVPVRKGDSVKIMKGKFKGKQGKVLEVKTKTSRVYIEGIQIKKMDGSKINVPLKASNLQITELNLEDKKRLKRQIVEKEKKSKEKPESKKEKQSKQIKSKEKKP